jgi:RNA polymerase sigma-70 factor (ECF subfamily)
MNQSSSGLMKLLGQARNGDADSLGLLLRNYFRYLNSLSRGHLDERIRTRVSASDIVQETLLEAHRDFQKFVGTSLQEFTGWLRKILFNNLARAVEVHLASAKRDVRRQCSLDEPVNGASHGAVRLENRLNDFVPSASSAFCNAESLQRLTLAISLLPNDYREVIQLRHYEGLSFSEIAVRLDRNPGATRMLWFRAVEKLKAVMNRDEQELK